MRVLVTYASRHGATEGIARAVAGELRASHVDADLREMGEVRALEGYDAAVIGSAVYMGGWLPEARRFVERNQERLAAVPVWLFSSGPLGAEEPKPEGDPKDLPDLMRETRARGHRVFAGRLDRGGLGFGERLIARAVHAPEGDFRDWDAIRGWAREIAAALQGPERD